MNKYLILILFAGFSLGSCTAYKQNIMFSHDENFQAAKLSAEARALERNYTIQPNDLIQVKVYTKNGEMIIDPEYELSKELNTNNRQNRPDPEYLVRLNGYTYLPMVGDVELAGLTLHEADTKLKSLYDEFFIDPFVITNYSNKRVTVLGAPGGKIIPLTNENITVAEVLAMAGGMQENGNAESIKLIRGDKTFLIDFSTIDAYYATNQIVQPGDIVYIEPIKRLLRGNAVEISVFLSLLTTTTTLLVLLLR
ncbi:MAG: polysaccharide biosynthesis/export family protein [Cyclobacteriaceae bacterium]|nr:polysaccharide biosynthesis/export family protein [Cyclobacteriaceae bacterium]